MTKQSENIPSRKVIFFDGVCNLCNWSIQFVIKNDKKKIFLFASLQSDCASTNLTHANGQHISYDSVVYQKGELIYTQSDAVLTILKDMGGLWRLFYIFKFIPKPLRDWVYNMIGANRYRWFGKKDKCMIPSPEINDRFLM